MITQNLNQTDAFLNKLKDPILLTKGVFLRNLCNNDDAFFHSFNNLGVDQIRSANESLANSNVRKSSAQKQIGYSLANVKA